MPERSGQGTPDVEVREPRGHRPAPSGQIRFRYDPSWPAHPGAFEIDPALSLGEAPFFPNAETGNFGVFLDSSPDRWGQTLMQRREALAARDDSRRPRTLHALDYLLGVQDATRQGAPRFRDPASGRFIAEEALAAPQVTSLGELESVARELTGRKIDDRERLRRRLSVLVAPGASLGGARPKANFTDRDGSLWIGKFPARDDDRDIGAWEYLAHILGQRAGIDLPRARLVKLSNFHTFCARRFDRSGKQRIFYWSAMTMLGHAVSEGTSYLELAEFLQIRGDRAHIGAGLEQLFRRVIFNVLVGNRDDHLRNHGFILTDGGWQLAPAFDVNPNIDKSEHVLNLDDSSPHPSIDTVLGTREYYRLDATRAKEIVHEISAVVGEWRGEARKLRIAAAEIEMMTAAFAF